MKIRIKNINFQSMIKFSRHGKGMRKIKIKELELQKQDRKKKEGKTEQKNTLVASKRMCGAVEDNEREFNIKSSIENLEIKKTASLNYI